MRILLEQSLLIISRSSCHRQGTRLCKMFVCPVSRQMDGSFFRLAREGSQKSEIRYKPETGKNKMS